MARKITLEEAKRQYVNRYTMEHVPTWARKARPDGLFYAPQYRTDAEWYANTTFPGEEGHIGGKSHCFSTGATWPLGKELKERL